MTDNMMYTSIDTDRELYEILSNFSEDSIDNAINEALNFKFRPFNNRMPNLPYVINMNFQNIRNNCTMGADEYVDEKEVAVYYNILNKICNSYNLSITSEIPRENLYSLTYVLYQILISEFTDRMLMFFSNYITINKDNLLASIPDNKKMNVKNNYTKKMYNDPSVISLYENLELVIDLVASLDIDFARLMMFLSDENTSKFITTYISDNNSIYTNHYASYINNKITRTDMITSIKIRFMESVKANMTVNAVENNPYIV